MLLGCAIPVLVLVGVIVSWPTLGCREPGSESAGAQNVTRFGKLAVERGKPIGSIDGVIASDGRRFLVPSTPEFRISIGYGESVSINGWAIDSDARGLASRVIWKVDSTALQATYGRSRPDVARATGSAALLDSGYDVDIPNVYLTPGPHRLSCYVVDASTLRARAFPNRIILDVARTEETH
jgi:hypothetical protein